jgi:flagellar hook assembly protein FlgD
MTALSAGFSICFQLENTSHLDAVVYSVSGHRIASLASGVYISGQSTLQWNGVDDSGRAVASGVYLLRLSSANDRSHAKLFLLRYLFKGLSYGLVIDCCTEEY